MCWLGLALAWLGLVRSVGAADLSPEARRRVASYQQGLANLPGSPGLSRITGGPAYGENGLLPSSAEWRQNLQNQSTARQATTGAAGTGVFGTTEGPVAEGAAGAKAEAAPGAKAEAAPAPTRTQRLGAGMAHHAAGYLQFSGVLASYVGVQLLLEIDKGNMKAEEFWPELKKLVLSKEAVAAYMSFVGVHSMAEKILAAGAKWGTLVPEAAALHQAATRMSTVTALRRMFLKQGILLTVVAGVIEVSVHWWKNMAHRPWEADNPDAAQMRGMSVVGSFVHSLSQAGNFTNTVGHVFDSFMKAVEEVDWIGLAVTSAAFVAGMTLTAFAPGWVQLVAGFLLSDLANRYLVPWIHRQITSRLGRHSAADALRYAYSVAMGVMVDLPELSQGASKSERIEQMMTKAEENLPKAFDKELEPLRVEYEEKVEALQLAAAGKLTSDLTNDVTHDWFVRRAQWQQIARLPGVVGTSAREAYAAAEAYSARAETQMRSLENVFASNDRRIKPMDTAWQNMRLDLASAKSLDEVWELSGPYLSEMRKFAAQRLGSQPGNVQTEGVERVIHLTATRYLNLVLQRMIIRETDPQLDRYTQDANATVYRAARTRAEEIRARLAELRLPQLAKEGRKFVRRSAPARSGGYNPLTGGGYNPGSSDPNLADLNRIERFVGDRTDRIESERQRVDRQRQTTERLSTQRIQQTQAGFRLIEAGRAAGEPLSTYVPLLSVLLLAEDVPDNHPLVKASVEHIVRELGRDPAQEKATLMALNPLITALVYAHRGVVPRELIERFRFHNLRPKFAGDLYQQPEPVFPGLRVPQWPPADYQPQTEAERAMLAVTELLRLQKDGWNSALEYQRLEENLALIEGQTAGILDATPLGYERAEHLVRGQLKEASELILELKEAEKIIFDLGYLEGEGRRDLDRPAWIVPHFDRDEGDLLKLEDRVVAQSQRMSKLIAEYDKLFGETVSVLDGVYAREAKAYPKAAAPAAGTSPSVTSTLTPEEREALIAWIQQSTPKDGSRPPATTPSPGSDKPSTADFYAQLEQLRSRDSSPFGLDGFGAPERKSQPDRDQLDLSDRLLATDDHQAYQPLLTFMNEKNPERLSYALTYKEPRLAPKVSPERMYRQTDTDRELERQDAVRSGRTDPALETFSPRTPQRISTIQCHGGNTRNCLPRPPPEFLPSKLALERGYENDPVYHGSKRWFRERPEGFRDAWSRWWRLQQLLKEMDAVEDAFRRTETELNPLRERLYPEETRAATPLPKVPARY